MKSVLLIGLGRLGKSIAIQLNKLGFDVMGVDIHEERVNALIDILTDAQIGDSTNEDFLRSLGVSNFDVCFVTVGSNFQNSMETTCLLKDLGAKFVVARAKQDVQEKLLLRNGADKVLFPEKQIARWAAIRYTSNHLHDYLELDETHSLFEVEVPKEWANKSILQLDIRKKYKLTIIAIKDEGKFNFTVTPDMILKEDDTILVLGEYNTVKKCFHI